MDWNGAFRRVSYKMAEIAPNLPNLSSILMKFSIIRRLASEKNKAWIICDAYPTLLARLVIPQPCGWLLIKEKPKNLRL